MTHYDHCAKVKVMCFVYKEIYHYLFEVCTPKEMDPHYLTETDTRVSSWIFLRIKAHFRVLSMNEY